MTKLLAGTGDGPSPGPILDAATVVLLRDRVDGLECLMLRKTQAQTFGGLWVFPGGRVEPHDGQGIEGARQAAVREATEETGLVVGPDVLVPVAHWTPPLRAPRRYRTWFFVAPLPHGAAEVVVDGSEIGDHVWARPVDALARHRGGDIDLLPPTWITLHRLADQPDVDAALADARARPADHFTTQIVVSDNGVPVALWEPDAAYAAEVPDRSSAAGGADGARGPAHLEVPGPRHRLYMDPAGWRLERTDTTDEPTGEPGETARTGEAPGGNGGTRDSGDPGEPTG